MVDNKVKRFWVAHDEMTRLAAEADRLCAEANESGVENGELEVRLAAGRWAMDAANLAAEILAGL